MCRVAESQHAARSRFANSSSVIFVRRRHVRAWAAFFWRHSLSTVSSLASCLRCLQVVIRGRKSSIYVIALFSSRFPEIHMEMEREMQGELTAPESPATIRASHLLSPSESMTNR